MTPVNVQILTVVFLLIIVIPGSSLSATSIPANQLYQQFCSVCHGENGDGNTHARQGLLPPPRDFTQLSAAQLSREVMLQTVRDGSPGSAMAAWKSKLNEAQITAIVDYIRTKFMTGLQQVTPETDTQGKTHQGRIIYAETCSVCHGDNGQGAVWGKDSLNPPPRDFTTEDAKQELDKQRMLASVTNGRPGTAMSAYGSRLSPNEVEAVVDYIREMFIQNITEKHSDKQPSLTLANEIANNKIPALLAPPDIGNGKRLYLSNCTACHGEAGDGNGPRAYFIFPKPRNFLLAATRANFDRKALFNAIENGVRGKEMPAWGKVLSPQHISDIAEYVYQAFIQPESSSASLEHE